MAQEGNPSDPREETITQDTSIMILMIPPLLHFNLDINTSSLTMSYIKSIRILKILTTTMVHLLDKMWDIMPSHFTQQLIQTEMQQKIVNCLQLYHLWIQNSLQAAIKVCKVCQTYNHLGMLSSWHMLVIWKHNGS